MSAFFSSLAKNLQLIGNGALPFAKVEALGTDFVWLLPHVLWHDTKTIGPLITSLANRTRGVGSDGIILWGGPGGGETSLFFFNRDGSPAEACGNGLRAVGVAGRELGLLEPGRVWFRIFDNKFPVDVPPSGVTARAGLGPPKQVEDRATEVEIMGQVEPKGLTGQFIRMPNPHIVVFGASKLTRHEKNALARTLCGIVKGGANIGFAVKREPLAIDLEVFERGVGWTQACGTGAAAAWAVAERLGLLHGKVRVRQPGGSLSVEGDSEGRVWIEGAARLVFVGWWSSDKPKGGNAGVRFLDYDAPITS
jgi:diaminopimelate epimerase